VKQVFIKPLFAALLFLSLDSCLSSTGKAEEYFALGSAYFDLGKYTQAEMWFNKSRFNKTTQNASEYYLGRIAYETGRLEDALQYFDRLIKRDKENVTAYKAAAYTCIKMKKLDKAEEYYKKVLELVPESYDEGYNYALVLMAMERPQEAEETLKAHTDVSAANNNTERPEALLLLARAQKEQGKPEAADAYSASLEQNDNPIVRMEYAMYLAKGRYKDKALAEYQKALDNSKTTDAQKEEIKETMEKVKAGEFEKDPEAAEAAGAPAETPAGDAAKLETNANSSPEVKKNAK
jgi:tetratricopeptide (TPR) repeat protein